MKVVAIFDVDYDAITSQGLVSLKEGILGELALACNTGLIFERASILQGTSNVRLESELDNLEALKGAKPV